MEFWTGWSQALASRRDKEERTLAFSKIDSIVWPYAMRRTLLKVDTVAEL